MAEDSTVAIPADAGITLTAALPARLRAGSATIVSAALPAEAERKSTRTAPTQPRYAIVGHAGSGGMATVHVAQDLELLRRVALKQLLDAPDLAEADAARLRFMREVQITAQLDHPTSSRSTVWRSHRTARRPMQ